jgi:hypothetical protein
MPFSDAEARAQLLDVVGQAADHLSSALGLLSGAHELLDERSAEALETEIFRPVQVAYGRLRRTHGQFAARTALPGREFAPAPEGAPARGVQGLIEAAVGEVLAADGQIATLQDSMLPVEVGDAELRAGLAEVRTRIAAVPGAARELLRRFGR